ncbi:MAG: ankyrin repeat protein with 8 ankyrin repeat [Pseudomonadota bacterium]|jgi:hypothetical protein
MKSLWYISWSQYSWTETRKILIASPPLLLNFNTNILDISINSGDVKFVKKVLETEENIDINELNIDGMTPLHIASLQGNLELVKFLVQEKNADIQIRTPKHEFYYPIGRLIKENSSVIDFSVDDLDLDMTIYFLELGLTMPKVLTIFGATTTGKEFCEQLYSYFQEKVEQHPEDSKFSSILKQVQDIKEDFYENTLGPLIGNSTKLEIVIEKENDTTNLIGEEDV